MCGTKLVKMPFLMRKGTKMALKQILLFIIYK